MSIDEDERLLTREEVETRYGVSKRYLEICVGRNQGPRLVRLGRMVRYRPSDIRKWLEQNTFESDQVTLVQADQHGAESKTDA